MAKSRFFGSLAAAGAAMGLSVSAAAQDSAQFPTYEQSVHCALTFSYISSRLDEGTPEFKDADDKGTALLAMAMTVYDKSEDEAVADFQGRTEAMVQDITTSTPDDFQARMLLRINECNQVASSYAPAIAAILAEE
jgi:hypothetical protein